MKKSEKIGLAVLVAGALVASLVVLLSEHLSVKQYQSEVTDHKHETVHDLERVRSVVKEYKDSIVRLYNRKPLNPSEPRKLHPQLNVAKESSRFYGTGWFIEKDLIVTNYHVTALMDDISIELCTGEKVHGDILASSQKYDLAFVDPDLPDDYEVNPLKLSDKPLNKYDELIHFGYPYKKNYYDFGATLGESTWGFQSYQISVPEHPVWDVKLSTGPGASGSPVFNKDGEVVAVVEGGYRGFDLGILIPVRYVQVLYDKLSRREIKNELNTLERRLDKVLERRKQAIQKLHQEYRQLQEELQNK